MKVLVFTTVFPNPAQPLHGLFVEERVRAAAALADIRVMSPVAWFRRRRIPGHAHGPPPVEYPTFYYVPGVFKAIDGLLLFLSALPAVLRLRRRFDFDLIDGHFGFPDGVAAILLGRWCRRPVTITLRGSELNMARYRLRRAAMAWSLRRAARVIAVSQQLADLAVSLGAPPDRVKVIGNGVDISRFRPIDGIEARQRLGVPEQGRLLVSVGHLARVKRFDLVLQALPAIAASHPAVWFAIVGGVAASSGSYPSEINECISRLKLSDRVIVTGRVAPDNVSLWLSAADLFVLSSDREGSPNALREAIACGCPVVASDVGDVRHVVSAETGVIVDATASLAQWTAAIEAALERPWNRAAIRAAAERLTWTDVAARVAGEWSDSIAAATAPDPRVTALGR